MIRRISNSEIATFKNCRRRWWLAWHRGLRPKWESPLGALGIGQNVHAALASYYVPDGQPRTDPREALEVILKDAAERLGTYWGAQGKEVPAGELKTLLSEADLQRIMLDGYVQWIAETGADQDFKVIESEAYVEVLFETISDLAVYIIGRLDVLAEDAWTGKPMFLDHKTTGSIAGSIHGLPLNPQMKMYRLILQFLSGKQVDIALYSMLRKVKRSVKAKPPFFHREKITHNRIEVEHFQQQLRGVIQDIINVGDQLDDGVDHNLVVYPTPGTGCNYCPFVRECHMLEDGSRAEDSLRDRFTVGEPLHYYGKEDLQRVTALQPGSRTLNAHPRRIQAG